MGAVTGKGLSDLIREEFGLRMTFFTMAVLGLADLGNIAAEFAGLASGLGHLRRQQIHRRARSAPRSSGRWSSAAPTTTSSASCSSLSLIYFTYPVSAFLAHPDWKTALDNTLVPQFNRDPAYIAMIVGLIGTTITPWMQFYLQASVVEKGITAQGPQPLPRRRHPRLHRHRCRRVLHRRRVRRDHLSLQSPRNLRRRRGRQSPRSLRRTASPPCSSASA